MIISRTQIFIAAFLFSISLSAYTQEPEDKTKKAQGQQPLNRQMTLEREYAPIVQDAAKINTLPVVREMEVSKRPIIYSDYAAPMQPDKEMAILPPGTLMTTVEHNKRNGYLHLAGGMLMNFSGDIGYHILNTNRDKLNIYFTHRSSNGNVIFIDEAFLKQKAKLNENLGGIDFKHHFDAASLSLGGNFGLSSFNYYGMPTNIYPGGAQAENDSTTNQGTTAINVYAGITSNRKTTLGYNIGMDYTNFKQKYSLSKEYDGMAENNIGLKLGVNSPERDRKVFGVDLKMNVLSYTAAGHSIRIDSAAFDTRLHATLNPYFKISRDTWKLLLGMNVMLVSENKETDIFVSPNIGFSVSIADFSLLYIDLAGGIESNTMYSLSCINRYINPAFTPDASKTWADMKLGVRSNVATGFWFDLFAGYKYTESDVFFNPSSLNWIDNGFNNVSMIFQPTTQRLQFGTTAKYNFREIVDFYVGGTYNYYNDLKYLDTWKNALSVPGLAEKAENESSFEVKAYGKPELELNAGIDIRPISPLTINLDYCMKSGIYAYIHENIKVNTLNDLRLRTSWKFNDTFSIYAQMNNLLSQKHEIYYGYPLQPFTAMIGVNLNF